MTEIMRRRRALMAAGDGSPTFKNGYEDATYDDGTHATVFSVANNILYITSWTKNVGQITLTLKQPIEINQNDVVTVQVIKKTGTVDARQYPVFYFNNTIVTTGSSWSNNPTAYQKNYTAQSAMTVNYIKITAGETPSKTYTDYSCVVVIKVNSVQILPEE